MPISGLSTPPLMTVNNLAQMLTRGNPDVAGVLVIDGDGRVHASDTSSEELLKTALAIVVPLRELVDRAATELGCGDMSTTLIEGTQASMAISDVDGYRSVVVVGTRGAALGALRADAIWVAEHLRKGGGVS